MSGNDQSAGATPAAGGATPSQTTPVSPAAAASSTDAQDTSATDDQTALGDSGKRALDRMKAERDADRVARRTLEQELADLKAAGQSESEKALAKARSEGASEAMTRVHAQVRLARVEAGLLAAGVDPSLLDIAARADEFASLKVTDDGKVEGLSEAIAAAKAARPVLFRAAGSPVAPGTADGGLRGQPGLTREAIDKMKPDEINARWDEVQRALTTIR